MAATHWTACILVLQVLAHSAHCDHDAHSDHNDRIDHRDHIDHSAHKDYGDHSYYSEPGEHNDRGDQKDHKAYGGHSDNGNRDRNPDSDHDPNSDHGDQNANGDHSSHNDPDANSDHGDHPTNDDQNDGGVHSALGNHGIYRDLGARGDLGDHGDHHDQDDNSGHNAHDNHSTFVDHSVPNSHDAHRVQTGHKARFVGRLVEKTEHILATTASGGVRGRLARDGNYFAFLGIPYAAAPTGLLRLKAPRPPPAWNGTLAAEREVVCPQQGVGEEDCLVVNVFVPKIKAKRALPVLVYIHGGAFRYGSGPTRGVASIVQQGVILVTINYRLGPLGFLCLGIDEAPGNAGLQDQVAALRWVKTNIKHFGGDPNSITLYGTDSGATCVEFLVLSNASADLFSGAVIESGASSATWAIDDRPLCTAKNFAKAFSVSELEHPHKLLELYQDVPASLLTRVNEKFANTFTDGTYGFAPCVERPFEGVQSIITSPPSELMRKERLSDTPLMFIFASLEGLFLKSREYYALNYMNRMEANFAEFLPSGLNFDNEIKRIEKAAEVRRFYFANETVENNKLAYLWYFGDSQVLRAVVGAAEAHARRGRHVYLMEFAHGGTLAARSADIERDQLYANEAGHGSFSAHVILNKTVQSDSDQLAIDRAATLLCNFVKYGEPTRNVTQVVPLRWPRLRPPLVPYLRFGDDLQLLEAPYSERIQFWKQLFYDFGKKKSYYESYHESYLC